MGNTGSKQFVYSTALPGTADENSSAIYRCCGFENKLVENFEGEDKLNNVFGILQKSAKKNPNGPFLGTREINKDGTAGRYVWVTYKEVETLALDVGSGLFYYDAVPPQKFDDADKNMEYRFIGIFSKNRLEWSLCDYAATAFGLILVPFYDTLNPSSITFILQKTQMVTIVASSECAKKLLAMDSGYENLKNLIVFDISDDIAVLANEKNLNLIYWKDVVEAGKRHPIAFESFQVPTPDSINTVCFTSGTTGDPKGVVITHGNFLANIASIFASPLLISHLDLSESDVILSYLPLAHVYERIVELLMCAVGGKIGYYCGDILKITDDIKALNPTVFVSVPRLFYRMIDKINSTVKGKSSVLRSLFAYAVNAKTIKSQHGGPPEHWLYDLMFFNRIKAALGENVRLLVSGSAPLSTETQATMKSLFCVPFAQGYGMTETMGGSFLACPADSVLGHVGGPVPSLEFKIESVLSMNYNAHGNVAQGELLLRGPSISPGFFRDEKAFVEAFDKDNWLHTGDIAELNTNGAIRIIDRKKNIFKLSQGEYIVPEKVEGIISQASIVEQIFVTGLSSESFAVAVVVPSEELTLRWGKANNMEAMSFQQICESKEFQSYMGATITDAAKAGGLLGFEIPKAVHYSPVLFSVENQLLTSTFKLKRDVARKVFKAEIEQLYAKYNAAK